MWETCPRSGVRTAGFGLVLLCGVWRELGRLDAIGSVGRDGGGRRWRHSAAGAAHLGFARRAARSRWRRAARRGRCLWGAVAQIFAAAPAARPPARAGSSITTSRWPASSGRVGLAGCPTPGGWRFRRAGRPARSLRARRDRDVFLPAPVARTPAPAGSLITTGRSPASSGRLLLAGSSAQVGSRFRRAGRPARSLHAWLDRGVFPSAPVARPPAPAGSSITTGCWPASSGRVLLAGSSAPVGWRFRRAGRPARSLHAWLGRGVFPSAPVARPPAPAGSFITTGCWPASSGRVLLAGAVTACRARLRRFFRRGWRPGRPRQRARPSRPAVRPRAAGALVWLVVPRRSARVFAERAGRRGRCTRGAIAASSRRRRWCPAVARWRLAFSRQRGSATLRARGREPQWSRTYDVGCHAKIGAHAARS